MSFLTNVTNEPNFTDIATGDYTIVNASTSDNAGGRLPADYPSVSRQYVHPQTSQARSAWGTGADLGAFGPA